MSPQPRLGSDVMESDRHLRKSGPPSSEGSGKSYARLRIIAAVAPLMADRGYARLEDIHLIEAADVSPRAFYEQFSDRQEAVLAAHDAIFERYLAILLHACDSEREWPLKVKAAVAHTIAFAVAEPEQAQMLSLDALAGDAEVTKRVLASVDHIADLLKAGRQYTPRDVELPELTEKALVGAVAAILAGRLMKGESDTLPELEPQIVELVLIPYLGPEEASRIGKPAG